MFFKEWGVKKTQKIRLAVIDMWKSFRTSNLKHNPKAAILFDKFHVMQHLGDAWDKVRKSESKWLSGKQRTYFKGQKYTLLSRNANLTLDGNRSLKKLLVANQRLSRAYLLKETFGQLWDYDREGWVRRFFDNWKAALKWPRLPFFEKLRSYD